MVTEIERRLALDDDTKEGHEFENFAQHCPHRILDQQDEAICNRHESAPGECGPEFCSLFEKVRFDETRGDGYGRSP